MKAETQKLLDKAARALRATENLLSNNDPDFAAGRAYHAIFYVAEALRSRSSAGDLPAIALEA